MKLYVANCSRQKHKFTYRIPEITQSFFQEIHAGHQIVIDRGEDDIKHILRQHEIYGIQPAARVTSDFSGICFSIDKPVTVNQIKAAAEQKTENLENQSQKTLENSAAAMSNTIDQEVIKAGEMPKGGVEIEIVGEAVNQEQDNAPSLKKTVKVEK